MKRLNLLFCLFFLSSCSSSELSGGCPIGFINVRYEIEYEYGSSEMSDKAKAKILQLANEAKTDGDYVCLTGHIANEGYPQNQLKLAMMRAQKTAVTFLEVGVGIEKLYIDVEPRLEGIGMSAPIRSTDKTNRLEVRIGK